MDLVLHPTPRCLSKIPPSFRFFLPVHGYLLLRRESRLKQPSARGLKRSARDRLIQGYLTQGYLIQERCIQEWCFQFMLFDYPGRLVLGGLF